MSAIDPQVLQRLILEESKRAGIGHIGPCLSVVHILSALYGDVLNLPSPEDPERDRFILSKGHAALALYAALHLKGWITREELATYVVDGTRLGSHPELGVPGVELSTGSLGQGLPVAAGLALAAKMQKTRRRVFALVSDAECNEGSTWEAVMFAGHHRLSNLVVIVDDNGQQALGHTRDVLDLRPLAPKWAGFGWDAREVDGHDDRVLAAALRDLDYENGPPHVVIARTVCGKGVSFMENEVRWHYLPMSDEQYAHALRDIEGGA